MTNFVVNGEILNDMFGKPSIGSAVYLPRQHKIKSWYPDWYVLWQRIQNHSMDSVISALKEAGIIESENVIFYTVAVGSCNCYLSCITLASRKHRHSITTKSSTS